MGANERIWRSNAIVEMWVFQMADRDKVGGGMTAMEQGGTVAGWI